MSEINDIVDALAKAIHDALDALDRGQDNDWAREALEGADRILDAYYEGQQKTKQMVRRNADGSLYQEMFSGLHCASCGCNVFYETSDGSTVSVICNSCGNLIGQMNEVASREALQEGIWKK